jgi:hypothetical protein
MTARSSKKNKLLSLYPLRFEQAVGKLLKIKPEPREKKGKGRKQT